VAKDAAKTTVAHRSYGFGIQLFIIILQFLLLAKVVSKSLVVGSQSQVNKRRIRGRLRRRWQTSEHGNDRKWKQKRNHNRTDKD